MARTWEHYVKQNKSNQESQGLDVFSHAWNLQRKKEKKGENLMKIEGRPAERRKMT